MKTKILKYGTYPRHNDVVRVYADVAIINEYLGFAEGGKDRYNPDYDLFQTILRVNRVCFAVDDVNRAKLTDEGYIRMMTERAKNFQSFILNQMNRGGFVGKIYIAAYEAMGWDAEPLRKHREEYLRCREEKERRSEEARRKLEEQRRREQTELARRRLDNCRTLLAAGKHISSADFIDLCIIDGIVIPPRTKCVLCRRVAEVSVKNIRYYAKDATEPSLTGCFKVIAEYIRRNTPPEPANPEPERP